MNTPDTDLLDPEKMREAIDRNKAFWEGCHTPWVARAARTTCLDELNRRLLRAKVAWWETGDQSSDDNTLHEVCESERLLHEAFAELERGT